MQGRDARDQAINDAMSDIEIIAALAAQDLNNTIADDRKLSMSEVLSRSLPSKRCRRAARSGGHLRPCRSMSSPPSPASVGASIAAARRICSAPHSL